MRVASVVSVRGARLHRREQAERVAPACRVLVRGDGRAVAVRVRLDTQLLHPTEKRRGL